MPVAIVKAAPEGGSSGSLAVAPALTDKPETPQPSVGAPPELAAGALGGRPSRAGPQSPPRSTRGCHEEECRTAMW